VLATSREELLSATQSKYAVAPVNIVLKEAERRRIDRLCIVGLPCHIAGIRKMSLHGKPKNLINRIKFAIGLFCANNRSHKVTEHILQSVMGIPLNSVAQFEYRGGPDSQSRVVTFRDGTKQLIPREAILETANLMVRNRCLGCWDFSSELADVSVGDIFLPSKTVRLPHYSAIITRTEAGDSLLKGAVKDGYITASDLAESGFTHNIGLEMKKRQAARRLIERKNAGLPVTDFHYDVSQEPPPVSNTAEALSQQIKDIPEIAEWLARDLEARKKVYRV